MRSSFLAGFVQAQDLPGATQFAGGALAIDSPPLVRVTNDLQEPHEGVPGHCSARRAARLEGVSPGALDYQDEPEGARRGALTAIYGARHRQGHLGHLERAPDRRRRCGGARERTCLPPPAPLSGTPAARARGDALCTTRSALK